MSQRTYKTGVQASLVGLNHSRYDLARHKGRCSACRYGVCKTYPEMEKQYLKAIAKHKAMIKRDI